MHKSLVKYTKWMGCLVCMIILWKLVKRLRLVSGLKLNTTLPLFGLSQSDVRSLSLSFSHTHTYTYTCIYTVLHPPPRCHTHIVIEEHWVEARKRRVTLLRCDITGWGYQWAWRNGHGARAWATTNQRIIRQWKSTTYKLVECTDGFTQASVPSVVGNLACW